MFSAIWNIWLQLSPWLLLGALTAGVLHVLVPDGWLKKHLSGRGGVLKAVAIGIPLPLCSCGVIPVGLGLRKEGASSGAAVGFLISTPQTGVDSVLVSGTLLGWPFAVLKLMVALVTGLVGGLLANLGGGTQEVSTDATADQTPGPTGAASTAQNSDHAAHSGHQGHPLPRILRHAAEMVESLWGWLLVGVLVSAAITWLVPENSLSVMPGMTGFSALLVTLVLSLPLYVCATASVPIAAALVSAGLPTGAALVFLMAGPATNVATLGAVYRALGRRALLTYLFTIVGGSLLAGLFFNQLLTASASLRLPHEHGSAWWQVGSAVILAALLLRFAVGDARAWWRRRTAAHGGSQQQFAVTGMTCNGCAARLEKRLLDVPGLQTAVVSYDDGTALISGQVSSQQVTDTITAAGFSVSSG